MYQRENTAAELKQVCSAHCTDNNCPWKNTIRTHWQAHCRQHCLLQPEEDISSMTHTHRPAPQPRRLGLNSPMGLPTYIHTVYSVEVILCCCFFLSQPQTNNNKNSVVSSTSSTKDSSISSSAPMVSHLYLLSLIVALLPLFRWISP